MQKYFDSEFYREKKLKQKRLLLNELYQIDSAKRRRIGSPTENGTTDTFQHLDPAEIDMTSVGSQSLIHTIRDRFKKMHHKKSGRRAGNTNKVAHHSTITTNGQSMAYCSDTSASQNPSTNQDERNHLPHGMLNIIQNTFHRRSKHRQQKKVKLLAKFANRRRESIESSTCSVVSTAFITIPKSQLSGPIGSSLTAASSVLNQINQGATKPVQNTPALPDLTTGSGAYPMPSNLMTPFLTPPVVMQSPRVQVPQSVQFGHNPFGTLSGPPARQPGLFRQMAPPVLPQPMMPPVPFPQPRLPSTMKQSTFSFTHGMSDQQGLVNPLEEKRRPDSSLAPTLANIASAGTNFEVKPLNANQLALSTGSHQYYLNQNLYTQSSHMLNYHQQLPQPGGMFPIGPIPFHPNVHPPFVPPNYTILYDTRVAKDYLEKLQQQSMSPKVCRI